MLNKINGYTEEEVVSLVEYMSSGYKQGKTLSSLFSSYGKTHGRAKGSVRNYYYALMRNKTDERVQKILSGKGLKVEKARAFTEEETDETIRKILKEKSKGFSVRRAICNLSQGDDKLMLRMQNKYRNVLKKSPEKIKEIGDELGVETVGNGFMKRRLEREIDDLYLRLTQGLKEENERLKQENERLKKRCFKTV